MTRFLLAFLFLAPFYVDAADISWNEVPLEEVDTQLLARRGQRLLKDDEYDWSHAQTDHFIIHFERKQFAQKVARMAEFFYQFISDDLSTAEDRATAPSHIFIFRREKQWEYFVEHYNVSTEWAFSMVSGFTMYLQQANDRKASGQVLGHEMTHMIFNRFYQGQLPLWLNEGTAEWYGTFGYEAYKGVNRNKRHAFRRVDELYPLQALLTSPDYPADPEAVRAFYETSKYLVGFLQLKFPENKFDPFLNDIVQGMESLEAIRKHYNFATPKEFADEFRGFSR